MSASVNQERERFEAWAQANGFGQSLPSTWAWQGWQAALSAGQATEPVGFIKEATEALLVEILDDDCDDLQSVRAIARTLRAAGQATESSLWFVHDVLHNCRAMLSDQDGAHAEIGRAMGMLRAGQVIPEPRCEYCAGKGETFNEHPCSFCLGSGLGASPPVEVGVTVEAREKLIARLRGCLPMFNERETVWCCVEGFDLRMAIDLLSTPSPLPAPVEATAHELFESTSIKGWAPHRFYRTPGGEYEDPEVAMRFMIWQQARRAALNLKRPA